MSRTVADSIKALLLAFPEVEETTTHGTPTYKADGKSMAYFCRNHHNDGRLALWLAAPPGVQQDFVAMDSEAYFVPPYVGVKGWLGVDLGKNLPWAEVTARVREAWIHCVPLKLSDALPDDLGVAPPDVPVRPEDIDPWQAEEPQKLMARLAELCERLPETSRAHDLGGPNWKAGKKTFVRGHMSNGRMALQFWVGVENQGLYTEDPRYSLPMYYHSTGWIELDVHEMVNWDEVETMLDASYRHFALKRMLKALDEN